MQAVAYDVVGRRTPTAARSSPARALNVEDLPEPVAPASATTVCSAESRSRAPARSTTAAAGSTTASSSRPRAASTACSSPSSRASSGCAAPEDLAGPGDEPAHDADLGGEAQVVDLAGEDAQLLGGVGRQLEGVEQVEEALALLVHQHLDARGRGPCGR